MIDRLQALPIYPTNEDKSLYSLMAAFGMDAHCATRSPEQMLPIGDTRSFKINEEDKKS